MKQGRIYLNIILGLFLAVVICYFGYYLHDARYDSVRTETAIEYEAGSGCYTTGFVVRDERAMMSGFEITTVTVGEGERVASGQSVATGYRSSDAQDRQARIEELEHELEQLDYAGTYSSDAADQAELEKQIESNLQALNCSVARRDMNACVDRSAPIKGLVLRQASSEGELADLNERIAALTAERQSLIEQAATDTNVVAASDSGYFSGNVDGFEDVLTPETIMELTARELLELEPDGIADNAVGKIIGDSTWYYITVVDSDLVTGVRPGDQVPVNFVAAFYDDLTMKIERIGEDEDGRCVLVLSCDLYMQDVTLLREQSADVVFSTQTGLRVPKEAIRVTEDRRTGVYVLEAGTVEWKYVQILHDNGESYVVKLDKTSTDKLWPGDEILLTNQELYEGKVVQQ